MKRAYPTFIKKDKKDYLVYVPDLEIFTEGKSLEDAMEMARDAIGLAGISLEDDGREVPPASDYETAIEAAKKHTNIFDFTGEVLTLVDVDFIEYRKKMDHRSVRRNVTIPSWLNSRAEKEHLNVSKVLQDALMEILGVQK